MAGLFQQTQENYYQQSQTFDGNGSAKVFTLLTTHFPSIPSVKSDIRIFVNRKEIDVDNYSYSSPTVTFSGNTNNTDVLESDGAPKDGFSIVVKERAASENFGNYQYVSINDIVNNFLIAYVGEGKLISKVSKTDVAFHAKRGLAEFSYDSLRSHKSQEVEVPPSLILPLPHDYVNYTKISKIDSNGVRNVLYPQRYTGNPKSLLQDTNYDYIFDNSGDLLERTPSETFERYKNNNQTEAEKKLNLDDGADVEWKFQEGRRFGLEPELSQNNGFYFIDLHLGRIHFSANLANDLVVIDYISDTLGTDDEMRIHKFAEEALYKHISYSVLASKVGIPEYIVARYKKERFAALRNAKLRLSNFKSEELAQVMRNKNKTIKN